jgi:outer membrane protein assembly factor BamD
MRKLLFLIPLALFLGCSSKEIAPESTPLGIHNQIYYAINHNNLDNADNLLLDLEASFPGSIYIKEDLLSLYYAHLNAEDYQLAKFYLDQYEKRFASPKEIPWCEYQKIKIDFLSYHNAYTNEKKLLELINECERYKLNYKDSNFLPEVNTIYVKALLTRQYLNDKIYKLYKKEGKKEAAQKYKTSVPKESTPPQIPWYKKLFYW